MNIDTFLEARELYDKYKLCEAVLEYLSDEETPKGQKYLETLKTFVNTFPNDFMMFVHGRMESVGMAFEDLKCCDCEKQPDEPTTPTEPNEPKFPIESKVEVTAPVHKGKIGTVKDYDSDDDQYYVSSDSFSMWFLESDLKAYVDESEEPTPPEDEDDKYEMVYGERVIVKSGEYAGKVGTIIDVMVGFTKVLVGLDDVEDAVEFTPDQLAKYTGSETKDGSASNAVFGQKFDGTAYTSLSGGTITSNGNG